MGPHVLSARFNRQIEPHERSDAFNQQLRSTFEAELNQHEALVGSYRVYGMTIGPRSVQFDVEFRRDGAHRHQARDKLKHHLQEAFERFRIPGTFQTTD